MLSICIPIFNFDTTLLVNALLDEKALLKETVEIILIDDASTSHTKTNKQFDNTCTYITLTENVGRSKIRNLFLEYANNPYLLFLDCDSLILSPNFIANYIAEIKTGTNICCGGRVYPEICPSRKQQLSWKYGIQRESKTALDRSKNPNDSFMTNNFLIQKSLLEKIRFDERISCYGHEDTLFGYELKKQHISIKHIENPILNGYLETNEAFIDKTEIAIKNLVLITDFLKVDFSFINNVHLLRIYQKVKPFHFLISIVTRISNPIIKQILKRGVVNIHLFNLYKLGVLISIKKSR